MTGLSSWWCACRNSKDEGSVVSLYLDRAPRRDEGGGATGRERDTVRVSSPQHSERWHCDKGLTGAAEFAGLCKIEERGRKEK